MSPPTPVSASASAPAPMPTPTPVLPIDLFKSLNKMLQEGKSEDFLAIFHTLSSTDQTFYAKTPIGLYDPEAETALNASLLNTKEGKSIN